jgi:hypothetical protein
MKIPLPAGNFIYIGKGSIDQNQTPFITKSADIIREITMAILLVLQIPIHYKITLGNVLWIFSGA